MGFKIKAPKISSPKLSMPSPSSLLGLAAGFPGLKVPLGGQGGGVDYTPPKMNPLPDPSSYYKEYSQAPKLEKADLIGKANIPGIYQPLETAAQRRYAQARDRINQETNANVQQGQDALTRKFSAMGMGTSSGAAIKLGQQAADEAEKRRLQATQGLDTAEAEESAQRGYQQAQQELGLRTEQVKQDYQHQLAQADLDFKNKVYNFDRGSKLAELDLAQRQAEIGLYETGVNAQTAREMARQQRGGLLTQVLGPIL